MDGLYDGTMFGVVYIFFFGLEISSHYIDYILTIISIRALTAIYRLTIILEL